VKRLKFSHAIGEEFDKSQIERKNHSVIKLRVKKKFVVDFPLKHVSLHHANLEISQSLNTRLTVLLNFKVHALVNIRSRWLTLFAQYAGRVYVTDECPSVRMYVPSQVSVAEWFAPLTAVRGSRFELRRWQLCLSRQLLRYTVLSTGCAPLLQCLGRLSLPPFVGR